MILNKEKLITSKIIELNEFAVNYLETSLVNLTPAGKYQASLLSAGIIIVEINGLIFREQIKSGKNLTVNLDDIYLSLIGFFIESFNISQNKLIDFENIIESYKNENKLKLISEFNKRFGKQNENFVKESYIVNLKEYTIKASDFKKDINLFISKQTLYAPNPCEIISSLYVYPFIFYPSDKIDEKTIDSISENYMEFIDKLDINEINIRLYSIFDLVKLKIESDKTFLNEILENNNNLEVQKPYCYIATMAYEDINHPKVQNFRDFRDNYLSKTVLGNNFIKYYYKHSPSWVKVLEAHKTINKLIRLGLDILNYFIPKSKL